MKKVVIILLVLAGAWFGGRWVYQSLHSDAGEKDVRHRVGLVLAGMRTGRGPIDEQTACCMWERGKMTIADEDELADAYTSFIQWKAERGIPDTVDEARLDRVDLSGPVPVAHVTLNGTAHAMRVPPDGPIAWVR